MKPGRNDPCPCESGRKYKNCSYVTAEGDPLVFGKCLFDATSEAPPMTLAGFGVSLDWSELPSAEGHEPVTSPIGEETIG